MSEWIKLGGEEEQEGGEVKKMQACAITIDRIVQLNWSEWRRWRDGAYTLLEITLSALIQQ